MEKRLPDDREAIEGAGLASANAARLLAGADLLAGAGHYGMARSMAVLAMEESVKARTLGAIAASAYGGQLFVDEEVLGTIVYGGHRVRHNFGFLQHVAATFPDAYGKVMLGTFPDAQDVAKIARLRELLAEANSAKQVGFYTDFDPGSGSWASPASVTEVEFAEMRGLISDYVTETQRQFDEFTETQTLAARASTGT